MTTSRPAARKAPAPVQRRDEILSAAARLFASDGYTDASMREVAAASGILPGSLYHHFASKEAIAVELIEIYHAELARVVREFRPADLGAVQALREFAERVGRVYFDHQAALQISLCEPPSTASASLRTIVHAEPASLTRTWRTLISAAVSAGSIDPDVDTRILRHVLHRTVSHVGFVSNYLVEPGAEPERIARCVTSLLFDGVTTSAGTYDDKAKPSRIVDEARRRWEAQTELRRAERRGEILDVALTEFAQRGFEATTTRDIADAAGIKASNLYRYFESKDSMLREILVSFSEDLLSAFREIISVGAGTAPTLDAILWLLNQAGRHFSREIELLTSSRQLPAPGDRYYEGAAVRLTMLSELIARGVADGELKPIDEPGLIAACLREIMWAPMKDLLLVSANRVRTFHRSSVLSGLAR